jgi:hypothetical protein
VQLNPDARFLTDAEPLNILLHLFCEAGLLPRG